MGTHDEKTESVYCAEGIPLSETLRSERILDQAP